MDFTLSEQQIALQQSVRKFAQQELPAIAKQIEESDEPPGIELRKRYAELGYLGVNLDEKYGGAGMSHLDAVIVLEEIAKISIAVAFPIFESCFGPSLAIAHFGSDRLREKFLPRVCSGEIVVAVSMSEPNAGSALTDLTTQAQVESGRVIINGNKRWIGNSTHGDYIILWARNTETKKVQGFVVDLHSEGITKVKIEGKMALRSVQNGDLEFKDVFVPADAKLAKADDFATGANEILKASRINVAWAAVGASIGSYDACIKYVT